METSTKYNRYAARIPKGIGVVGSLSFDVQGRKGGGGGVLAISDPFGQTEKGGRGCKNWTFFMDDINVWSLTDQLITGLWFKSKMLLASLQ